MHELERPLAALIVPAGGAAGIRGRFAGTLARGMLTGVREAPMPAGTPARSDRKSRPCICA